MSRCVLFMIYFYFVPRDKINNVVFKEKLEKWSLPIINFVP